MTVLLVVVGIILGVLIIKTQSVMLAAMFFGWVVVGSFLMYQVKCPKCSTSLTYKGKLGVLPIYAGFANKRCQNCGFDLTKPEDDSAATSGTTTNH
jgi:endogenous inhibitor of DNA gyrase (YacG/DUF329 family)